MVTKFAFLPVPDFTLSPLSLFIDTLRLAGDEGDRSRRLNFDWQILGDAGLPIQSSCGLNVLPSKPISNPEGYDCIVVVGGLLKSNLDLGSKREDFLKRAASLNIPLTALCTGSFVLAHYGLLNGYEASVSWFHIRDFRNLFPEVKARADRLFSIDRGRATCAGGAGAADLAGHFAAEFLGSAAADKAARILMLDRVRTISDVQPAGDCFPDASNRAVKKALLLMESNLGDTLGVLDIAAALNLSRRQLERLFLSEIGIGPMAAYLMLRLEYAKSLLQRSDLPITEIGLQCGFTNSGHFGRTFKKKYGMTPSELRFG